MPGPGFPRRIGVDGRMRAPLNGGNANTGCFSLQLTAPATGQKWRRRVSLRQCRQRVESRKSRFGEKQKGIRSTTKDVISKEKIRSGSKFRNSGTATSNGVKVGPSRHSATKQEDEIGVADRGDQKICHLQEAMLQRRWTRLFALHTKHVLKRCET